MKKDIGDIHFSVDIDYEYIHLAEKYRDGTATEEETEQLRKMVDEAAKKAGYNIEAWHGTSGETFTVFEYGHDRKKYSTGKNLGEGFYFATSKEYAENYADNTNQNARVTNSRLGCVAGELAKNAIPINALKVEAKKASGTHAMVAYAKDSKEREFVAILTIEQYSGNISKIETFDVLHAISGRQKNSSRVDTKSQGINPSTAAKIRIADLIEIVNTTYQSILSDDVLKTLEEEKDSSGYYSERVKFSIEDDVAELDEGYRHSVQRDAAENEPTGKNGSVLPQRQSAEPDYENISFEIMEQQAKDASLQQWNSSF